jgi:hypothetical protein
LREAGVEDFGGDTAVEAVVDLIAGPLVRDVLRG